MNTTQIQNSTAMQFAANLTLGMMADVCEHTLHVLSHEQLKNRVRDLRQDAERALAGMNEAKASTATAGGHTTGPWKAQLLDNGKHSNGVRISSGETPVAFVYGDDEIHGIVQPDKNANARLVCQAPAMLEALKAISDLANDPAGSQFTLRELFGTFHCTAQIEGKQARAIIAAVEGKR